MTKLYVANIIVWSFCVGAHLDEAITTGIWWRWAFVIAGVAVATLATMRLREHVIR